MSKNVGGGWILEVALQGGRGANDLTWGGHAFRGTESRRKLWFNEFLQVNGTIFSIFFKWWLLLMRLSNFLERQNGSLMMKVEQNFLWTSKISLESDLRKD